MPYSQLHIITVTLLLLIILSVYIYFLGCKQLLFYISISLKDLDIETLKELSTQVSVIPVIAKGDTMTEEEKFLFKKMVIDIYHTFIFAYQLLILM